MKNEYWRISYDDTGIYEAMKNEILKISDNPKEEWDNLKKTEAFTWLKVPTVYPKGSLSYFTKLGYDVFIEKTYPIIIKYLDSKKIITKKYAFGNKKINIVYEDEHQIVINNQ